MHEKFSSGFHRRQEWLAEQIKVASLSCHAGGQPTVASLLRELEHNQAAFQATYAAYLTACPYPPPYGALFESDRIGDPIEVSCG